MTVERVVVLWFLLLILGLLFGIAYADARKGRR